MSAEKSRSALVLTLEAQQDLNKKLVCALNKRNLDLAIAYVRQGAYLLSYGRNGENILHLACRLNNPSVVDELLTSEKVNQQDLIILLMTVNKVWMSPLMIACKKGYNDIVEILLRRNLNNTILTYPNKYGFTPLMYACIYGHTDVVDTLLKHRKIVASINTPNNRGRTPLMYACMYSHTGIISLLLQRLNAEQINYVKRRLTRVAPRLNQGSQSAFSIALIKKNPEILALLLDHPGLDITKCATKTQVQDKIEILQEALTIWAAKPAENHIDILVNVLNEPGSVIKVRQTPENLQRQINGLKDSGYIKSSQCESLRNAIRNYQVKGKPAKWAGAIRIRSGQGKQTENPGSRGCHYSLW